jgi:hypothetical protein
VEPRQLGGQRLDLVALFGWRLFWVARTISVELARNRFNRLNQIHW